MEEIEMPKEDEKAEDQNVEETDEVDEDETDDNEAEEPTIEELKAQIAEKDKALKKANAERTRLGKKLKEAPKPEDKEAAPDLSDKAKRALAISYLRTEGLSDVQAKKFAKLVDLEDIEIDDDGDLVGIDLDELKEDFPELFAKAAGDTPAKKNGGRKPDTGDKSGNSSAPSGLSEASKRMLKISGRK
jgi:uncharacterized coiled-coil protein SlyX